MNKRMLAEFNRSRDEALLSMDIGKILAHCVRYGVYIPDNIESFWAGVHKARIAVNAIPEDEKEKSRAWLTAHGFSTEIN